MKTHRRRSSSVTEHFTLVDLGDVDFMDTVCHVCEAEFLDEENLKQHMAEVHETESNGKIMCELCCRVLASSEDLVSHLIFEHIAYLKFCVYCYRAFSDPIELELHELKHCVVDTNSVFTCSQCPTILSNKLDLQNHEYKEHRNSDGYMLNSFFPLLSSLLNIKIDKFVESLRKKAPLSCLACGLVCSGLTRYIAHLEDSNCRSLACDTCCSIFKKKMSIASHMAKSVACHNSVIQEKCPKCDKYFNVKDIKMHQDICNVLRCPICHKHFYSVNDLTDHRIKEHQVIINIEVCKFCKKEFIGAKNLKKHIHRRHNKKLYKYNCVHCGSLHMHPSKLFTHFYSQHKDINPFTCKICNIYFRLRKQFTIHIKLIHKSVGFVEFDKNLHVIFTDKKSEHPVEPKPYEQSTTDASDSDNDEVENNISKVHTEKTKQANIINVEDIAPQFDNTNDSITSNIAQNITSDSNEANLSKARSDNNEDGVVYNERFPESQLLQRKLKRRRQQTKSNIIEIDSDRLSDDDDEPLSNIKKTIQSEKKQKLLAKEKRKAKNDKRDKLTCKICNKYCYTVQNYHHHSTLHENTKLKKCIKCHKCFSSRQLLNEHMATSHSSSRLTETLKWLVERRQISNPTQKLDTKPSESFKSLLEQRKKTQGVLPKEISINKFKKTIKKVDVIDDSVATITPVSDHGLSVKNFIENFKPETETVNISNCVTIKALTNPADKEPMIKMKKFNQELPVVSGQPLRFPVKFKEDPTDYLNAKVNVKLVQQLITKPKLVNMTLNEKIPVVEEKSEEYCNMFADETDYTQYKNETIPEVAHEVMLQDTDDIPRTKRLEQEIIIPKIPKEHGSVKIGHLLPQAPYYKIVPVSELLESKTETIEEDESKEMKLPDGTQLVSVKNPYGHLIPNKHLEEVLKANSNKYYKGKQKSIRTALAKALRQTKAALETKSRKVNKHSK